MIGTLLKIKPVLQIQGYKLDQYAKVRKLAEAKKVMSDAIAHDLDTRFKELREQGKMALALAHTQNEQEAMTFKAELEQRFPDLKVMCVSPLSLSVACHIGPGALACAAFITY